MAGWLCKNCHKAKTYRRLTRLCADCDTRHGLRGFHNKKIVPARRVFGKTNLNKAMIAKKKPKRKSEHDTSTAVAAASGRALDLRTALEMEFPRLKSLCDLAECHGVLAQAHLIVRVVDKSGQTLPEATPTVVKALLYCALGLCAFFTDEDQTEIRKKLRDSFQALDMVAVRKAECVWHNLLGACKSGFLWK
ncbi:unnamed protein product [Symbiodinium natans]|uniref:Uncharacterized protein n=1 Tax=Symbiodinium natans TaxID=878477 RepID=A0A812RG45_9DINO|nr:unnamed protein product [Symbiodinium natans]